MLRTLPYENEINQVAKETGLSPDLLRAVMMQESGGNAGARGGAGEIGLMQTMPGSAAEVGVRDLSSPYNQLLAGGRYLKKQIDQFGSIEKGLAAYNAGPGNVQRGTIPQVTTQNYVPSVLKQMGAAINSPQAQPQYGSGISRLPQDNGLDWGDSGDIGKTLLNSQVGKQAIKQGTQSIGESLGLLNAAPTVPVGMSSSLASATEPAVANLATIGKGTVATTSASPALSALGTAAAIGGIAAGGYGTYQLASNLGNMSQKQGIKAGLGSGASLGAGIGTMILPGVGTLVGGGIGALAGSALGAFASLPQTQVEEKRWIELAKEGKVDPSQVPQWVKEGIDIKAKGAGARPDLGADFVGLAPTAGQSVGGISDNAGDWVNNVFAKSRNEADLRPEDIWGYATWQEKFGQDWMSVPEEVRRQTAQKALDMGLVDEHHGTVDVKDSADLDAFFRSQQAAPVPVEQPIVHTGTSTTVSQARPATTRPTRPRPTPADFKLPAPPVREYTMPDRLYGQDYEPALADVREQNTAGSGWWKKGVY